MSQRNYRRKSKTPHCERNLGVRTNVQSQNRKEACNQARASESSRIEARGSADDGRSELTLEWRRKHDFSLCPIQERTIWAFHNGIPAVEVAVTG